MLLTRYLKAAQIRLELRTQLFEKPHEVSHSKFLWDVKEAVLDELCELFFESAKVKNKTKLFKDIFNRERKASTAVGNEVAVPHVRTQQVNDFVIVFGRSTHGLQFDAPDGQPVKIFIGVIAPPHNDKLYLQVYRKIGIVFSNTSAKDLLMVADNEHDVIKIISNFEESGPAGE